MSSSHDPDRLPVSTDSLDLIGKLSDIRLVAIDIDGTLLDVPSGQVADVIADLNSSLRHYRRSVTLTIATGRAFAGAHPVVERLHLSRRTPVILYNGAVVCNADGTELKRLFAFYTRDLELVVQMALRAGLVALAYEPDTSMPLRGDLHGPSNHIVERVTGFAAVPGSSSEFNGLSIDWHAESPPERAAAVVIPTPDGAPQHLVDALAATSGVSVTMSSPTFLEVRPAGANKGAALAAIAFERGLDPSEVLAIGDSDNDIEMLRWAGCSVAVANSTIGALDASNYRTEGFAAQGVVETLRLLYDARRHRLRP